ncbi:MAG: pyridoxamine 5'-phosphate oxidase family protein [Alphaproteobacteria bacterium]|nr:pyridoxamine 5'-phosphate oxidase family protein [Alphaproteobacteria bacterium]
MTPAAEDPFSRFTDVVGAFEDVRDLLGAPNKAVRDKVIDRLDEVCRAFIARSPFLVMATAGADGHLDLSPKGDPAGFVRILDDTMLAIPDRPGNRRADSFRNLLENPRIGLIFVIPGKTETLRVGGTARIVRDRALRESLAVQGKVPELAVAVHVERAFIHCPKCMVRSGLWTPDAWPDHAAVPGIGEAMVRHARLDITAEELDAIAEREGLKRLY